MLEKSNLNVDLFMFIVLFLDSQMASFIYLLFVLMILLSCTVCTFRGGFGTGNCSGLQSRCKYEILLNL